MALPREPRQKMINIMYLVLTAILALNVSAEILEAFKTVDRSLINSNVNIESGNKNLFSSLAAKLADPNTNKELAQKWSDNAAKVKVLSDELDTYINGLKLDLKKAANLVIKEKEGKQVEDFKEDNLDASTRLFETHGEGKKLQDRLRKYKSDILMIDSAIGKEFLNNFPVEVDQPIIGNDGKQKDFTTAYFHMTPTVAALTILSKFQNNIKNAENQVVTYCHNKIGQVEVHMDQAGILVGQSSNYLMPGQELTITAGVGAYSSSASPTISINGSGVVVNQGQGSYKTTVSGTGEHSVSVNVSFKDESGKIQTKTETVKYVVGVPGGSAVMLDKMNVFYIGVDNPITISSGSGWDKTTVTPSGCTITGSGSNRIITVTTPGAASLTVTADGKSSKFDFRVKMIPDPVFKVASGKPRMPSVEFKNQQYCRAELEKFDFDTRFSVVSATVYFSGAGFPNVATTSLNGNNLAPLGAYLAKCTPGSVVTFDNVKVSGPGGTRIIEGRSFALY